MSIRIIQERFDSYQCRSAQEEENALREITQEVILAALSRTDFFDHAGFQGGTCLRIFYSLNRFSEDLDFILKKADRGFSLSTYMKNLALELGAYGYALETADRSKVESAVKKIFLKDDSLGKVLTLNYLKGKSNLRKINIKLEIDTNPPEGSGFENKFSDFPFPYAVTAQDLGSLFAGKNHALLCREYTKGRDWYDFIWYASRKAPINYAFLSAALNQAGPWKGKGLQAGRQWYLEQMEMKIRRTKWAEVKEEMSKFVKPEEYQSLKFWGIEFFMDRLAKLAG